MSGSPIAAPPAWVMALPLDPGAWRVLVGLWSFADFDADGEQVVGPSRAKLAERVGIKPRACRKQLSKLTEMGYVSPAPGGRFGSLGLALHWLPGGIARSEAPEQGERAPEQGIRAGEHTGETAPKPAHLDRSPAHLDPCPPGPVTGTPGQGGVSTWTAKPAHLDTQTLQDPAVTLHDPPPPAGARTGPTSGPRVPLPDGHRHAGSSRPRPGPRQTREPSADLTEAIRRHGGAWVWELEGDQWRRALAEAEADLELQPEHVEAALAAWDRQAEGGVKSSQPGRRAIWYRRHRRWLREAAGLGADVVPLHGRRPMGRRGCDADKVPTIAENDARLAEARARGGRR